MNSEKAREYLVKKVREIAEATGCTYVNVTMRKPSFGGFVDDDGEECGHYAGAWTDSSGKEVNVSNIALFDRRW